jgi:hypothetical protein
MSAMSPKYGPPPSWKPVTTTSVTKDNSTLYVETLCPECDRLRAELIDAQREAQKNLVDLADEVGRNHSIPSGHKRRNHSPIEIAPRWLAVQQQQRGGPNRTFVDIGHSQAVDIEVMRGVWPIDKTDEAIIGSAHEVDSGRGLKALSSSHGSTLPRNAPASEFGTIERRWANESSSLPLVHAGLGPAPPPTQGPERRSHVRASQQRSRCRAGWR